MDSIFGFVGKDFVLLACDSAVARSVLKLKVNSKQGINHWIGR